MKILSYKLDRPFKNSGWFEHFTVIDSDSFDAEEFTNMRSAMRSVQGQTPPRMGMDLDCYALADRDLDKCELGFGWLEGFHKHAPYTDAAAGRFLFQMNHHGVSTVGMVPFLLNAVLPDTADTTEIEAQVRAVESLLSVAHAVKTIEGMAVGDKYPPYGKPEEREEFIEYILCRRPVHLWLPCHLIISPYDEPIILTPPRTMAKNDKYLRHIQMILAQAKTVCAMYAVATILDSEGEDYTYTVDLLTS